MRRQTLNSKKKFYTGVTLDWQVVAFLDSLVEQTGWSRSLVLNTIVRQYAQVQNTKVKAEQLTSAGLQTVELS